MIPREDLVEQERSNNANNKKHTAKESRENSCVNPIPRPQPTTRHKLMSMKMDMTVQQILFGHYFYSLPRHKYLPKDLTSWFSSGNPEIPLPLKTVSQLAKRAVIPAKAGIQFLILFKYLKSWMPAFAGMTNYDIVS